MNLDGIQAITFDAVGTLIVPYPSVGEVYAEELSGLGYNLSPELLERKFIDSFRQFKRDHPDALLDRESWYSIVGNTLRGLTNGEDFAEQFEVLWDAFTNPERWRILPGIVAALQSLQADGLRLFVLSNNDDRLHTILNGLKIDHYFEAIFVSAELGAEKPAARLFELAQAHIKVAPMNILHVGDSLAEDVQGALEAGWQAALVGDSGTENSGAPGRFRRAHGIRELFLKE